MKTKTELRAAMKALRDKLSAAEIQQRSRAICDTLLSLAEVKSAVSVFVFVSCRSEVSTHRLIQDWLESKVLVTVPKTDTSTRMSAHRLERWEQLVPGRFGILEPLATKLYSGAIDLCITPGLAFTERGDRLGYGAGHYDRFVAEHPNMRLIALAFDEQIIPEIPTDSTDWPMQIIVTDKRVIRI